MADSPGPRRAASELGAFTEVHSPDDRRWPYSRVMVTRSRSQLAAPLLLLLSTLLVVACSDDGASPSADAGVPDAITEDSAVDRGVDGGGCALDGITLANLTAERDDSLGVFFVTGRTAGQTTFDVITVDFYFKLGAKDGPQTLTGSGENLADCHSCVMLRQGCVVSGCAKAKAFLWQSGTLQVDAMGQGGESFGATLRDAAFAEVTVDPSGGGTTLVPGGATWCVSELSLAATVTTP